MTERELIKKLKRLALARSTRYKHNALDRYNTDIVHHKQVMFHKDTHRNRWVFGGNRSGKTECGAVETVWRARGIHQYRDNRRTDGWVISVSKTVQREVAQKKILYYLKPEWIAEVVMESGKASNPSGGIVDYISVKNVFGTLSTIGFRSHEQGREKLQGTSLDYVWFDEEPPEDIYNECAMRVIDRRGDIYGTMTPLKGLTFVYNRIYLNNGCDSEISTINMEWADNPYLDEGEIDRLSATMTATELQSRRYGKFVTASGLVYPEFDENIHVIPPFDVPHEWYDNLSIDPGLNNPLSCHWYACDGDDNVYVIAEHFAAGQDIVTHSQKILAVSRSLGWHFDRLNRVEALIDSASNQHTLASSMSVAELFATNKILVNTNVNKDMFSGINRVKRYLKNNEGKAKLFVFATCTEMIKEFKSYWWGKGDVPKKVDDHALDELRYYLMSKNSVVCGDKKIPSILSRHKDRLIRRNRLHLP